jgi:O-antigen ligase
MVAKYQDVGLEYYKEKHYHPHNQYLEELMEIGIPGLLLFLLAWLAIPFCAKEKGRETAILFTALFMMNMLTDCMFGKFCGIALWAVGMMFMLMQSRPQSHEEV